MLKNRTFRETTLTVSLALLALIAIGCRQSTYVSQENPSAPLYHIQGVDFNSYDTAVIKLDITVSSNGEIYPPGSIDERNAQTTYSLNKWLTQAGYFNNIIDSADNVRDKAVIINAEVSIKWRSSTDVDTNTTTTKAGPLRIKKTRDNVLLGERWGEVSIAYDVYDKDTHDLIAKMHVTNAGLHGFGSVVWDEGVKNKAYRQIEKWNAIFVDSVLGLRAARAEVSVRPDL
ncbi:MAG: hypothetical protein HY894_08105 [Deltaproteobacteria bacterium]|nr:hypothetical protein [Deltaproteobacteria bacterium]